MPDLFGAETQQCRTCRNWTGTLAHAEQQCVALCKIRSRFHVQQRTFADDTCEQFVDAQRRAA